MNAYVLIRNISLYKLGLGDLNFSEKKVYDFLSEELSNLVYSKFDNDYDDGYYILSDNTKRIIGEHDGKIDCLYLNFDIFEFIYDYIDAVNTAILLNWHINTNLSIYPRDIRIMSIQYYRVKEKKIKI